MIDLRLDDIIFINSLSFDKALKCLSRYLNKSDYIPPVNYTTTSSQLFKYINGDTTADKALSHSAARKHPVNARCNKETTAIGINFFINNPAERAFKIPARHWGIRSDILLKCTLPFGYVRQEGVILFSPQYRKDLFVLDKQALLLKASVIRHVFAREDFEGSGIQTLDMSFDSVQEQRKSIAKLYSANELILAPDLYKKFDIFLDAWDTLHSKPSENMIGDSLIFPWSRYKD